MNNQIPRFVVKYWIKEKLDFKTPPVLKHAVFYDEEDLIIAIRNIRGNYFIYEIGEPYKSKEYFDKIFADEILEKEKQEFERLKQKFQ